MLISRNKAPMSIGFKICGLNPIPTGCCHVILIYGLIPLSAVPVRIGLTILFSDINIRNSTSALTLFLAPVHWINYWRKMTKTFFFTQIFFRQSTWMHFFLGHLKFYFRLFINLKKKKIIINNTWPLVPYILEMKY